jgi:hypothetical protein
VSESPGIKLLACRNPASSGNPKSGNEDSPPKNPGSSAPKPPKGPIENEPSPRPSSSTENASVSPDSESASSFSSDVKEDAEKSIAKSEAFVIGLSVAGALLLLIALAFIIRRYLSRRRQDSLCASLSSSQDSIFWEVNQAHTPKLEDEIELKVGDMVVVKEVFDDGWASGLNLTTEKAGSFPLNCLSDFDAVDCNTITIRDSSMTSHSDLLFELPPMDSNNDNSAKKKQDESGKSILSELHDIYSAFKIKAPIKK